MITFFQWLEAINLVTDFHGAIPNAPPVLNPQSGKMEVPKDAIGVAKMATAGFRSKDRTLIEKGKDQVEQWLDSSTAHLGIHWSLNYMEPADQQQSSYPTRIGAVTGATHYPVGLLKQTAKPDWDQYLQHANPRVTSSAEDFYLRQKNEPQNHPNQAPPNPNNTIVYVKSTSRVHGLSDWQQIHNIGHAVWGHAKKDLAKFTQLLRQTIYEGQQKLHDKSGKDEAPTWAEMIVILGRLLDLHSYQRIFKAKQGGMDDPKIRANTSLNNFMEGMNELVAAYLRNKGRIPLRPRGAVEGRDSVPDRIGKMQPVPEIERKFGVRPWVWEALAQGDVWKTLADGLTKIVEQAILSCVYAKAGPLHAVSGYLTTEP